MWPQWNGRGFGLVLRKLLAVSLALSGAFVGMVATPHVASATGVLFVGVGGSDTGTCQVQASPCATVSYAVSQSGVGDTINVGAGTFSDNVTISHDLTIQGAAGGTTVAARSDSIDAFKVTAGAVNLLSLIHISEPTRPY